MYKVHKTNHIFAFLANIQDAGKYMVRAVNAGGEAQSIADFAVMEPTPERMVEVVKTVVFDNTNDKKVTLNILLTERNHILPSKSLNLNNLKLFFLSLFLFSTFVTLPRRREYL